jgi:hypothetical protein
MCDEEKICSGKISVVVIVQLSEQSETCGVCYQIEENMMHESMIFMVPNSRSKDRYLHILF